MTFLLFVVMVIAGFLYSSPWEWTLHRFVMHRPVGKFDYPFKKHALEHHRIFKANSTYTLQKEEDKWTIPMAWWNGPVLILIATAMISPLAWQVDRWWSILAVGCGITLYYAMYEYIHWCMHLPKNGERFVERLWIFHRLNAHHLLHHRHMNRNFNVVLPLADWCFGTLLSPSQESLK